MLTPRARLLWPFLIVDGLFLAALLIWAFHWQGQMRQAQAPIHSAARMASEQRALFAECEKSAGASRPRDPHILAIRSASCLSIRLPEELALSPTVALLSLHSLSASAARLTLAGESPEHLQELALLIARRGSAQAAAEERSLLAADQRVRELCQGAGAWLCRLSGADPDKPHAPGAAERLAEIHKLGFRAERPDLALQWIEQGSIAPDPAEAVGRQRAQAARAAKPLAPTPAAPD